MATCTISHAHYSIACMCTSMVQKEKEEEGEEKSIKKGSGACQVHCKYTQETGSQPTLLSSFLSLNLAPEKQKKHCARKDGQHHCVYQTMRVQFI